MDFGKVALSPDGHMVAIATERADWDAERFREDLWLWRDSDGVLIPLTQSGHDSDPEVVSRRQVDRVSLGPQRGKRQLRRIR